MTTRVTKQSVAVILAPTLTPKKIRVTEMNFAPYVEPLSPDHEDFLVDPGETFETTDSGTFRTKIR